MYEHYCNISYLLCIYIYLYIRFIEIKLEAVYKMLCKYPQKAITHSDKVTYNISIIIII